MREFLTGTGDGDLWGTFSDVFLSGSFDVDAVSNQIIQLFSPPRVATSGPSALGILSGALGITGAFVPEGGEGIAAAAEVAASVTDIVEASTADANSGESTWDPYGFHSTVSDLHSDLATAVQDSSDGLARLADLIVSDADRLSAAGDRVGMPTSDGGWDMSTDVQDQLKGRLLQSMRQFMWLTMSSPWRPPMSARLTPPSSSRARHQHLEPLPHVDHARQPEPLGWPELLEKKMTDVLFGQPN